MSNKRNAKQPNRPPEGQPWIWHSAKLKASVAWRAMSINARRALDRIELEHMAHAGTANGNLIVTHKQFIEAGVSQNWVGDALDELQHLRLIQMQRGRGGTGGGTPNRFTLTWLPIAGNRTCDDLWQKITQAHVDRWQKDKKMSRKRQRRSRNPAIRSKEKIQKPSHPLVSSQSPYGDCGASNVTKSRPNPSHPIVTTSNILQGYAGRSYQKAQGQAQNCKNNSHTELARKFGDDAHAWEILTSLSPDTLQSLLTQLDAGTINQSDIDAARHEAARSLQSASQQ